MAGAYPLSSGKLARDCPGMNRVVVIIKLSGSQWLRLSLDNTEKLGRPGMSGSPIVANFSETGLTSPRIVRRGRVEDETGMLKAWLKGIDIKRKARKDLT
jgi:hypothetical protein